MYKKTSPNCTSSINTANRSLNNLKLSSRSSRNSAASPYNRSLVLKVNVSTRRCSRSAKPFKNLLNRSLKIFKRKYRDIKRLHNSSPTNSSKLRSDRLKKSAAVLRTFLR